MPMMCKSYELCNRMVVIMLALNMQFIQLTVFLVKNFINVSLQYIETSTCAIILVFLQTNYCN